MFKKGFTPVVIALITAILVIGGIAGYILTKNKQPNSRETTTNTIPSTTTTLEPTTATTKLVTTTTIPVPTPTVTTTLPKSKVNIDFPTGRRILMAGQTYKITWSGLGSSSTHPQMTIAIALPDSCGPAEDLPGMLINTSNTGSYNLTIPSNISPGQYRLCLESGPPPNLRAEGPYDASDLFTISSDGRALPKTRINRIRDTSGKVITSAATCSNIHQEQTIIIEGSNFGKTSFVKWTPHPAFDVYEEADVSSDGTELTTTIPCATLKPGIYQISVVGPGLPGNTFNFTITP